MSGIDTDITLDDMDEDLTKNLTNGCCIWKWKPIPKIPDSRKTIIVRRF